jgi:hypothetical protein
MFSVNTAALFNEMFPSSGSSFQTSFLKTEIKQYLKNEMIHVLLMVFQMLRVFQFNTENLELGVYGYRWIRSEKVEEGFDSYRDGETVTSVVVKLWRRA